MGLAQVPVDWSPCSQPSWEALGCAGSVSAAAGTDSDCGEQQGWVCVWNGGGELSHGRARDKRNFFCGFLSRPLPRLTTTQGPESLGEGAGTDQIFPLSPQPCNTAHLISPAHPEGNSSSKSCPEFSFWPANSALGVGELLGSGDTSGTPFCIKKREAC